MRLTTLFVGAAASLALTSGAHAQKMSFFITSVGPGKGADLGGLEGADRHCADLANTAGVTGMTWRAYLSAVSADGKPAVNARDRIGKGPWYNARGVMIAKDLAELHSEATKLGKEHSLNEKGMPVNGRGDTPNMHDILTGSRMDGTVATDTLDTTCRNWTSSLATGSAWVGHHDRQGGGVNPTSWGSAHPSRGCGQDNLRATGGNGLYYCFAI